MPVRRAFRSAALAAALLVLPALPGSALAEAPSSPCPASHTTNTTTDCPKVTGTAQVGKTLSTSVGEWSGTQPLAFAYQWQRCADATAGSCANLPGENESEYLVAPGDNTNRLRVMVTASNSEGAASRPSAITAVVVSSPNTAPGYNQAFAAVIEALAPASLSRPLVGDTLRLADGAGSKPASDGWFNPPATSYAYQWRRCAADGALDTCVSIPGATERTYKPTNADGGHALRVRLTGSAGGYSRALLSAASNAVAYSDRDGDGVTSDRDCDDADPGVKPGAADAPGNGRDEDCSGSDSTAAVSDSMAPTIGGLALTPPAFPAAASGPSIGAGKGGSKIGFRLSETARVTFTVERSLNGVKKGGLCVATAKRAPAKGTRCTRFVKRKGSFGMDGVAGANAGRFSGRLNNAKLPPGRYRLSAIAKDGAGNLSAPAKSSFRITLPRQR